MASPENNLADLRLVVEELFSRVSSVRGLKKLNTRRAQVETEPGLTMPDVVISEVRRVPEFRVLEPNPGYRANVIEFWRLSEPLAIQLKDVLMAAQQELIAIGVKEAQIYQKRLQQILLDGGQPLAPPLSSKDGPVPTPALPPDDGPVLAPLTELPPEVDPADDNSDMPVNIDEDFTDEQPF